MPRSIKEKVFILSVLRFALDVGLEQINTSEDGLGALIENYEDAGGVIFADPNFNPVAVLQMGIACAPLERASNNPQTIIDALMKDEEDELED